MGDGVCACACASTSLSGEIGDGALGRSKGGRLSVDVRDAVSDRLNSDNFDNLELGVC